MPSSYQVVLWKQESFVVLRLLQIEFFRNLLGFSHEAQGHERNRAVALGPGGACRVIYIRESSEHT